MLPLAAPQPIDHSSGPIASVRSLSHWRDHCCALFAHSILRQSKAAARIPPVPYCESGESQQKTRVATSGNSAASSKAAESIAFWPQIHLHLHHCLLPSGRRAPAPPEQRSVCLQSTARRWGHLAPWPAIFRVCAMPVHSIRMRGNRIPTASSLDPLLHALFPPPKPTKQVAAAGARFFAPPPTQSA